MAEQQWISPRPPETRDKLWMGRFGWNLQGFMETNPAFAFSLKAEPPGTVLGPADWRDPSGIAGYLPTDASAKATLGDRGFYPYSEAGYFDFRSDGTFTGIFRLNIGGDPQRYSKSRPTQGTHEMFGDGTGRLILKDAVDGSTHLELFVVAINDNEMLLSVDWVNRKIAGRSTGIGVMRRMTNV